tara:strand:- start:38664 stop:39005 length:342 start_codon:yes stop_codon:yes gene_type:complete
LLDKIQNLSDVNTADPTRGISSIGKLQAETEVSLRDIPQLVVEECDVTPAQEIILRNDYGGIPGDGFTNQVEDPADFMELAREMLVGKSVFRYYVYSGHCGYLLTPIISKFNS